METEIYRVHIDPGSLRPNPGAGRTSYRVLGVKTVTFLVEGQGTHIPVKDLEPALRLVALMSGESSKYYYQYMFALLPGADAGEAVSALEERFSGARIEVHSHQPTRELHSITPERKYLFRYVELGVSCKGKCGWSGTAAELNADYTDLSSDPYVHLCPSCGHPICDGDELTYETVDGFQSRLGLTAEESKTGRAADGHSGRGRRRG